MAYPQSAGVYDNEIDLTTYVSGVSTSEGALAGVARWGALETRMLLDNEDTLVNTLGRPTNFNAETFFTASNFLSYSDTLYFVRAANTTGTSPTVTVTANSTVSGIESSNATVVIQANSTVNTSLLTVGMILMDTSNTSVIKTGSRITSIVNGSAFTLSSNSDAIASLGDGNTCTLQFVSNTTAFSAVVNTGTVTTHSYNIIKNETDFESKNGSFEQDVIFVARCPGELGNSLKISVCDSANTYSSSVAIGNSTVVGVLSVNEGSNTGTVVFSGATVSAANTFATNFLAAISETDYLLIGNTAIGEQYMKLTSVPTTPSTNSTNAFVSLSFEETSKLIDDFSITSSTVSTIQRYWEYFEVFDGAPGQSQYMLLSGNSAAQDELHAVVVDEDGKFTGVPGTILEKYFALSRGTDSKTIDGASNYYRNVINDSSRYVWSTNDISGYSSNTSVNVATSAAGLFSYSFKHGYDGSDESTVSIGVLADAYDMFESTEDIEISILMQGKARGGVAGGQLGSYIINNLTETRTDCVVCISPAKEDVVNNVGNERASILEFAATIPSSSYAILDSGYKYMYDRYNDIYRWVPLNGDIAGIIARSDATTDPWQSPGGFNRGQIKNIIKLAYNPRKTDRDALYKNRVNPVVTFPNEGTFLYGDKTALAKPSAFDRINVRRLFIVLRKAIKKSAKYIEFELNDAFTRAQFKNLVTPYLRDVKGRRGISDFLVVSDESNNTPERIDRNEFWGDIYIKPNRSINYVILNFIGVRTGVAFSEVIGQW